MRPYAEPATVTVDGVTIRYGPTVAVDDATLHVAAAERVVITGSNGSGKSSLLRGLLGLVAVSAGSTLVGDDTGAGPRQLRQRRRVVAYVPQRTSTGRFPLVVDELLASSGAGPAAVEAADRLGIGGLRRRPLDTLSGGQLQRAYLARALGCVAAGARVLVADEPTSALDFQGQEDVAAILAEVPVTTLVVSHDAAVVARAGRVFEMAGGRIRERAR